METTETGTSEYGNYYLDSSGNNYTYDDLEEEEEAELLTPGTVSQAITKNARENRASDKEELKHSTTLKAPITRLPTPMKTRESNIYSVNKYIYHDGSESY